MEKIMGMSRNKHVFFLAATLAAGATYAQEVPDFGSSSASAVIVDAPPRERGRGVVPQTQPPPPTEEVVVTGGKLVTFDRVWSLTPGFAYSENREVMGVDLGGKRERGGGRSDQILLGYSNIDPDGSDGPFDQGKLRYRNKFAVLDSGLSVEGQAQVVKRWDKFVEESAHLNLGFRPVPSTLLSLNAGYAWRDRDGASTLKDRDLRFAVTREIQRWGITRVSTDYRLENDIIGEDDFSAGIELKRGITLTVGKHWVAAVSFTQALNAK
jgi:hypothetical protein